MATVKFPSEMAPATSIGGNDKLMISKEATGEAYQATFNQAKEYLNITGIELEPLVGGDTEATALVVPNGPAGEQRTVEVASGKYYDFGSGSQLADADKRWKAYWSGTAWSLKDMGELPIPANKIDEWTAGTYTLGVQKIYQGQVWEVIVTSTSSTPGVNGDWKPVSGIETSETPIYNSANDVVIGEWIAGSNGVIVEDDNGKRTVNLLFGDSFDYIKINGRDSFFSGIYFRDGSGNPVGYVSKPGNTIIKSSEVPANAKGIILNLKNPNDTGNRDISSTLSVVVVRNVVIDNINSRIDTIENTSLTKKTIKESYKYGDQPDGFTISSTGVVSANAGYSIAEIDISNAYLIQLANFPSGLRTKWFYDANNNPLFSIDKFTNGDIYLQDYNLDAKTLRFVVKTPTVALDPSSLVNVTFDDVQNSLFRSDLAQLTDVYKKINKQGELHINIGEILAANGNIGNNVDGAWTGLIPIPETYNYFEITGVPTGLNSKIFYNKFGLIVGSLTLNNGIVDRGSVPDDAEFIGFNVKTATAGDGTLTTKIVFIEDDLAGVGVPDITFGIPSVIPVVVGTQMNLYYSNLALKPFNDKTELFWLEGPELNNAKVNPFQWKTVRTNRALQYSPLIGGETVDITAKCRASDYTVIGERKFQLKSIPNTGGNNIRKVILIISDSQVDTTFDGGKSSLGPYLRDMLIQSGDIDAIFVGTQNFGATIYGNDVSENRTVYCRTEAYGGTTYPYFYEATSPFWSAAKNDTDFVAWLESMRNIEGNPMGLQAGDVLDYVFCPCGANDFLLNYPQLDPTPIIERAKIMMQKVWQDYPNCKYIIGMPTMGSHYWGQDYRRRWNIAYFDAVVKEFEKPEYSGKVLIASEGLWSDDLYANRIVRPYREPYARIVDAKNQLINKLKQEGLTEQQAIDTVINDYGLKVEERMLEKWENEYPATNDVTHSGYVGAMQQADCIYAVLRASIMDLI